MGNDPEEIEAQCEVLAEQMGAVFQRYIRKMQKRHPAIVMPVLLNVCSRLVVGAVRCFPPEYQENALKEFASLLAQRYNLAKAGITPEASRIVTLN